MQRTLIDDRYELGESLGGGGMGYVYLAHDRVLGRDVALKLLRGQYTEDEELVERFRREAQNAASLSHPNIVQTYDRGETGDGGYYIAMEHVPGGTLSGRVDRDGALPAHIAAEVGSQVADALGAAHEAGLIHRDIKPQNVLVTERGDVKVADFGIARAAEDTSISRTSAVLGTAAYMSPEQVLGKELGPRSDLYSLGVVLYEMLTGDVPFRGASPTAVSLMHVNEEPHPPAETNPEIPDGMNALVMKLLAKDPAQRYGSASELVEDLDRVSEGLSPLNAGLNAGAGGFAAGGLSAESYDAEATTLEAYGAEGAAPDRADRAATTRAATSPRESFRVHRGGVHGNRFKRLLAMSALAIALIGALGWLVWPAEGPGVAGSLDGVPEIPGKAGEAFVDGLEALTDAGTGLKRVEVPRVAGLEQRAATERLDQAGFDAESRSRQSTEEDADLVLEQSVPAGDEAEEGSTILLAVGSGLPQGGTGGAGVSGGSSGNADGGANAGASGNGGGSYGVSGYGGNSGSGSGSNGVSGGSDGSGSGGSGSYVAPAGDQKGEPSYGQYESGD